MRLKPQLHREVFTWDQNKSILCLQQVAQMTSNFARARGSIKASNKGLHPAGMGMETFLQAGEITGSETLFSEVRG